MPRAILDESHIHPAIRDKVAGHHRDIVQEIQEAIARHAIVVVGMAQNPAPRRARKLLDAAGLKYHYLEYGSYFDTLAAPECAQDVDRLADLSHGVRQGRAGRRGRRPGQVAR